MYTNGLQEYQQASDDYSRIEAALRYLEENYQAQPTLEEIAASVGLSEYHFQRLFTRWVGISPKRFLQFLTKEHAKELLEQSQDLLSVAFDTGLSGPGRLHDLFVACEAVTPGEYKRQGEGLEISYGFHPSPFGECMLALTGRGICGLAFVDQGGREELVRDLSRRWERANLQEDPRRTASHMQRIFSPSQNKTLDPLPLLLNGTNFQIKVWEALLHIPPARLVSYEEIAVALGMPSAARAVSRAVATNPIAFIIPCHRVIRKMGAFGGYRWGMPRKKAILGWEMARAVE